MFIYMDDRCANCGKVKSKPKNKYCSFKCVGEATNKIRDYSKHGIAISKAKLKGKDSSLKVFTVVCEKCKITFTVEEITYKFPTRERYYCSSKCSHSRIRTDEMKVAQSIRAKKQYNSLPEEEKIKRANRSHRPRIFRSKGEIRLLELLKQSLPDFEFQIAGSFSYKGVIIGRDIISFKKKICIEYDGAWHFKNINNQVEYKQGKDKLFEEFINDSDFRLIRVTDNNFDKHQYLLAELIREIIEANSKVAKLYHFNLWPKGDQVFLN